MLQKSAIEKSENTTARKSRFLPHIESFRGVAACVVVVHHVLAVFNRDVHGIPLLVVLPKIFNGEGAVYVFFVLSGFVLGLSLDGPRKDGPISSYLKFSFRRILRIYPAFLFSMVLILLYLFTIHKPQTFAAASAWFNQYYQTLPPLSKAWDILIFKDVSLNNPAWTLRTELLCSFVLPPFHFLCRRLNLGWNLIVLIGICAASDFVSPLRYFYLFYMGLMIPALNRHHWFSRGIHPLAFYTAFAICLIGILQTGMPYLERLSVLQFLPGISALGLVALIASENQTIIHQHLHTSVARFLGKISYSLYLLHWFALYLVATWLLTTFPAPTIKGHLHLFTLLLLIGTFLAAIPLAWLSWRLIEVPAINFSKILFSQKKNCS